MKTFWSPELGHFNSNKDDLSDLGDCYLDEAKRQVALEAKAAFLGRAYCFPAYLYSRFECPK